MSELRSKMDRVCLTRVRENQLSKIKYDESSQKRLFKILETKLKTSFIGSLSQFEQQFGDLWGYRKDESELTQEEYEMRQKWNIARTNTLNNGNNQIRAILNELSQYTITWNRYQLQMKKTDNNN